MELAYEQSVMGKIAIIGINRPQFKNALNNALLSQFENAIQAIRVQSDVRVVVVRSLVPGVFCAGADLRERLDMEMSEVTQYLSKLRQLMSSLENFPQPVICAIDGVAVGGGLEVALACDIRIAASTATMGLVETRLGIIPGAGGTQRLSRAVGLGKAKELIFTARILRGDEAREIGLVNRSVKQNEGQNAAFKSAMEMAHEIMPNGPISVQMAKVAINTGFDYANLAQGLAIEENCYDELLSTIDRNEGLRSFLEKRKPKYIGK